MGAVFKREFRSYFTNMSGYIFIALFLAAASFSTTYTSLYNGFASFEYGMSNYVMFISLMVFIPILAMKSFADDRRLKTDRLLFSLPIRLSSMVLEKYFAMLSVFAIPVLVIAVYPVIFSAFGEISFLTAYTCIFGFFLLGASLISLCMFISTLTDSQIIAAVGGFGAILLLFLIDTFANMIPKNAWFSFFCFVLLGAVAAAIAYGVTRTPATSVIAALIIIVPISIVFIIKSALLEGLFSEMLVGISLFNRYDEMSYGVFDLTAIVYFLTFTAFFIFLSIQSLEHKRQC